MKLIATISFMMVIALTISTRCLSQDAVFSQFYASGLYLNPALAGVESETFLGANYRSQWNNLALPFTTFQASFIQPVFNRGIRKKHLGGFGASVLNDVAGPNKEFTTQAVSVAGAWNLRVNHNDNHMISFALQAGVGQQRINYDNLHWSSQYSSATGFDPGRAGESSSANYRYFKPILNTGLMWSFTPKKNGVSYYNGLVLNNNRLFKTHGGITIPLSHTLDISPNYLVVVQGANKQINIGAYGGYSLLINKTNSVKLIAGAWYRVNDGMILSAGMATRKINVGFSYDNNMSSMGKTFGYAGAYELSVSYRAPGKNNFKRISSPLI